MEKNCLNYEQNRSECCCVNLQCPRRGACCDCIRHHRALGSTVACMRSEALEASKKPSE